jgi:hypothetical protein
LGFGSGIDSDRFNETFVFTVMHNGNTSSFNFVPADYPPNMIESCVDNNFVENGIGIVFPICWIN